MGNDQKVNSGLSSVYTTECLQRIFEYVQDNSSRFLTDLQELVRQPSISAQNKGMVECAQLLEGKMKEAGIDARTIPTGGYPVVFGEVKSKDSERTILVYGHYDVQPPEPLEEWESPPFAAKIQDGKIFGREPLI